MSKSFRIALAALIALGAWGAMESAPACKTPEAVEHGYCL